MYDSYKLMEHIEKELNKKADNGFKGQSDLDIVMKLTKTMKNLMEAEYYGTVIEAMEQESGGHSHSDGYSERRRRDRMGRYSREGGGHSYDDGSSYNDRGSSYRGGYSEAKGDYMDAKHSYRSTRSPESKRDVEASLHECMTMLKQELDEMEANADTREEREKIRAMRREISNLA